MSFNIDDFIKKSLNNLDYTKEIFGIDEFLKSLEFHYFSTLKLIELFTNFNTGRWGTSIKNDSPLQYNLEILNSRNNCNIDIEELTIFLKDTSIVIKRIYDKSIATQLNDILKQIAFNYVFLTRGLTQKPYEIFVPIFEDSLYNFDFEDDQTNILPKSYSEFWGIYLDKEDEASIFDIQANTYVTGDLEFLSE